MQAKSEHAAYSVALNLPARGDFRGFNRDTHVKRQKAPVIAIPVKLVLDLIGEREFRKINCLWTPAFAGVTALETFYETINR